MRHALLALAGIASLAAVVSAAPAAAQSYGYGYGQDPMGRGGYGYGQSFGQGADQGNMEYLDQDSRVQPAPIPRQLVQFVGGKRTRAAKCWAHATRGGSR